VSRVTGAPKPLERSEARSAPVVEHGEKGVPYPARPAVTVNGAVIPLQEGKKYRLIYYTRGTQNARPRTPAEERRYAELLWHLDRKPSTQERQQIMQELQAINSETASPALVTDTFWVRPPGARDADEPPDSEITVIDLRNR
jgi:hypothetical protein